MSVRGFFCYLQKGKKMNKYFIQQRIKTLIDNWVNPNNNTATFEISGITIEQDFTYQHGPTGDYWIAKGEEYANSSVEACNTFWNKLVKITSRISLVGQGFIQLNTEPYLVTCQDANPSVGLLWYTRELKHVGLSFNEQSKLTVDELINSGLPDEFFLYWQDATNTIGYSAKLLVMFAALESLINKRDKKLYPKARDIKSKILGEELLEIFFEKGKGNQDALRNQLSHGRYLSNANGGRDYVTELHKKIVGFMNETVLRSGQIEIGVEEPQRNFYDNKEGWGPGFIKRKDSSNKEPLSLVDIMNKFDPYENTSVYNWVSNAEQKELGGLF